MSPRGRRFPALTIVGAVLGVLIIIAAVIYATKPDSAPKGAGQVSAYTPPASSSQAAQPKLVLTSDLTHVRHGSPSGLKVGRYVFGAYDTGGNQPAQRITATGLTAGPSHSPDAASYIETRLPSVVRVIGATVTFPQGNAGSVALVNWASSLVARRAAGKRIPYGSIHFVLTPDEWILGVFDYVGNTGTVFQVKSVMLSTPLARDKPVRVVVTRAGSEVTVTLNGESTTADDPRFAVHTSGWASWELFDYTPNMQTPTIASIEAG